MDSIKTAFPVGCFVRAFRDDEMWAGIVKEHGEGYLTVRFSNLTEKQYDYSSIDVENRSGDSTVIYQFDGGLANNLPVE